MPEHCSSLQRRKCVVLALIASVVVAIAWASVSSRRALAGARHSSVSHTRVMLAHMAAATGLPGWSVQYSWSRHHSGLQPDDRPEDSGYMAMADLRKPHESSAGSAAVSKDAFTALGASADAVASSHVPESARALADASAAREMPVPGPRADADAPGTGGRLQGDQHSSLGYDRGCRCLARTTDGALRQAHLQAARARRMRARAPADCPDGFICTCCMHSFSPQLSSALS